MNNFIKVEERYIQLVEVAKINYGEILLLSKIISLANNENKACTAGNAYFSKLLYADERTVRRYIKNLRDKGLVKTFEQKEGMRTTTRYIYPQIEYMNNLIAEHENEKGQDNNCHTGQFLSEDRTELTKGQDNFCQRTGQNCPPIREEKRIKEIRREPIQSSQISEETKDKVIECFKEHKSYKDIASECGVNDFDDIKAIISEYTDGKQVVKEYVHYLDGSDSDFTYDVLVDCISNSDDLDELLYIYCVSEFKFDEKLIKDIYMSTRREMIG